MIKESLMNNKNKTM